MTQKKIVPFSQYKKVNPLETKKQNQIKLAQRYFISKELKSKNSTVSSINKSINKSNYTTKQNTSTTLNQTSQLPPAPHFSQQRDTDEDNLFQGKKAQQTVVSKSTPTLRTARHNHNSLDQKNYNPHYTRAKLQHLAEEASRENGDTGSVSLSASAKIHRGSIKTANTADKAIKTYYVARNLKAKTPQDSPTLSMNESPSFIVEGEKIKRIKSAKIDEVTSKKIWAKKRQIYRNYQLKDLMYDRLVERKQRIEYENKKTEDSFVEATKFAMHVSTESKEIQKQIVHTVKMPVQGYKFVEKQKANINHALTNSRFKNTQTVKNMDKKYLAKQQQKKRRAERYQKTRINKGLRKLQAASAFIEKAKKNAVFFVSTKIILPIIALMLLWMGFSQLNIAVNNSTNIYAAIGAEKNVIEQYQSHVAELDSAFKDIIRSEEAHGRQVHDEVIVNIASDSGEIHNNFKEFLVLASVLYEQNLKCSSQEINKINEWYDLMNGYDLVVEPYQHENGCIYVPPVDDDDDGYWYCPGHTRLYINVYCLTMEDLFDKIRFTEFQIEWARQLMLFDLDLLYPGQGFETEGGISGWNGMSSVEIMEAIANLPKSGATRDLIVETALSLNGRVPYFWGGKSAAGYNSLWNTPQKVTSPGTSDYNKVLPYGLDCSGYIDWVFKTAGATTMFNGGTAHQWGKTYAIDKKNALPGDLVFKNPPNSGGINHVGIFIGTDAVGRNLFIHCSYGNGVAIDSWNGFKYWRRAMIDY